MNQTYDPRLLNDDPWLHIPNPPLDLPKELIYAHRLDHSPPSQGEPPEELLERVLCGNITDDYIDDLIAERRRWAKKQLGI